MISTLYFSLSSNRELFAMDAETCLIISNEPKLWWSFSLEQYLTSFALTSTKKKLWRFGIYSPWNLGACGWLRSEPWFVSKPEVVEQIWFGHKLKNWNEVLGKTFCWLFWLQFNFFSCSSSHLHIFREFIWIACLDKQNALSSYAWNFFLLYRVLFSFSFRTLLNSMNYFGKQTEQ